MLHIDILEFTLLLKIKVCIISYMHNNYSASLGISFAWSTRSKAAAIFEGLETYCQPLYEGYTIRGPIR